MATGDKVQGCEQGRLSAKELKNMLLVKTNTGVEGLRTHTISASAANVTPLITCDTPLLDDLGVAAAAIGLNPNGNPALIFIEET